MLTQQRCFRGVIFFLYCVCVSLSWPATAAVLNSDDARYLLTRSGFSPDPTEVLELTGLSREQAINRIFSQARRVPVTSYPDSLNEYLPRVQLRQLDEQQRREYVRTQKSAQGRVLRTWWLNEMLKTPSPLTERMTLFWHNHFVSSQAKVVSAHLMLEQNLLLRKNATGNFGQMLHEVAKDPAMMIYLDSASNRKGQPNENFAREVMELFTLGEGNYSERDVKEVARALTGWSIDPETGQFMFRPKQHDEGMKTVLGKEGNFDGDQVLDILLAQPETSEFIVGKLWKEFVSPQPDPREVKRIAQVFRQSHYDIQPVLRELFLSDAFWTTEARGALMKSPVDLVVGTLRALDVQVADSTPFVITLRQLGQDLFAPPNVRGWPGGETWVNTATLLARKQFLDRLMRSDKVGQMPSQMASDRKRTDPAAGAEMNSEDWVKAVTDRGLTPQRALLVVAPVDSEPAESHTLRTLLLDSAYEVK